MFWLQEGDLQRQYPSCLTTNPGAHAVCVLAPANVVDQRQHEMCETQLTRISSEQTTQDGMSTPCPSISSCSFRLETTASRMAASFSVRMRVMLGRSMRGRRILHATSHA